MVYNVDYVILPDNTLQTGSVSFMLLSGFREYASECHR